MSIACGRIVASHHRPSTSFHNVADTFGTSVSETTARPNPRSGGEGIITICEVQVWGTHGAVDKAKCECTPRCAADWHDRAVRRGVDAPDPASLP